jgi:hypothetical protein
MSLSTLALQKGENQLVNELFCKPEVNYRSTLLLCDYKDTAFYGHLGIILVKNEK